MAAITKDSPVEDLVHEFPGVVSFLIQQGLPCVVCGEPFWGSLGDLARQKGWSEDKIDILVEEFNARF